MDRYRCIQWANKVIPFDIPVVSGDIDEAARADPLVVIISFPTKLRNSQEAEGRTLVFI